MYLPAHDPRLAWFCPQPIALPQVESRGEIRLDRFPASAYQAVAGQIGPTANLRSSTGCALIVRTDSPWVELRLDRLRHHQPAPVGVALEAQRPDGGWLATESEDLRERSGAVTVRLASGRERGSGCAEMRVWLPLISTAVVIGVELAEGATVEPATGPEPGFLVIGDSLAQGFVAQSPRQSWPHRLGLRLGRPGWNLGVGGLLIEPSVVDWALAARRWPLVVIALGGNHAWREADAVVAADRAAALAELALTGGHGRVVWCLPPWKPCDDGLGPREFAGVALDAAAAQRGQRVRAALRERLAAYAPRLELADDLAPRDARLYADGLHPAALGFQLYEANLARFLGLLT